MPEEIQQILYDDDKEEYAHSRIRLIHFLLLVVAELGSTPARIVREILSDQDWLRLAAKAGLTERDRRTMDASFEQWLAAGQPGPAHGEVAVKPN